MKALDQFEPIAHLEIVDLGIKVNRCILGFAAAPLATPACRAAVPRATFAVHLSEVTHRRTKCRVKLQRLRYTLFHGCAAALAKFRRDFLKYRHMWVPPALLHSFAGLESQLLPTSL